MRFIVHSCFFLGVIVTKSFCEDCPPLTSKTVDISYEGNVTSELPLSPGSKAILNCRTYHEYSLDVAVPPYKEIICLDEGIWDPPLFECIPVCGESAIPGYGTVVNGWPANLGAFPWHVAVYYMNWTGPQIHYICGGSLISPDLVVSAAHCFYIYDPIEGDLRNDRTNHAVAAGKIDQSIHVEEERQQISAVLRIYIPRNYEGPVGDGHADIAVLRLVHPFTVTPFVRPVCIDWSNNIEDQLQNGSIGKIMGWGKDATGYPSEKLQEINLPYIDYEYCWSIVPEDLEYLLNASDKICAGYTNGSSMCHGDSGGGLCFKSNDRWYLRGILSVGSDVSEKANETRCNHYFPAVLTNLENYTNWMALIYNDTGNLLDEDFRENQNVGSCDLPEPPENGYYKHDLCNGSCNYVTGVTLPVGSSLKYYCDADYFLNGSSTSICQNGVWSSNPTCINAE